MFSNKQFILKIVDLFATEAYSFLTGQNFPGRYIFTSTAFLLVAFAWKTSKVQDLQGNLNLFLSSTFFQVIYLRLW